MIAKMFRVNKKNTIGYFFLKLGALALLVFLLDFIIGSVLRHYYFKQESGLLYRTTYAIEKTTDEFLVFGSSRANHHYHPEIFENQLHQSYYNVGRDGLGILYHYAVLKAVLKRYTPKTIVLDFIAGELDKDAQSYERLSCLLPYYKNHPEIRPIVHLKSPYEKFKLCSSVYPYSSQIFTIAAGNAEFNKKRRADLKGYVPLWGLWNSPAVVRNRAEEHKLDPNKVKIFESFIKECRQNEVKLYIVCSPYYDKSRQNDPSLKKAAEIAKNYSVAFFDYSVDTSFTNKNLFFSDAEHLNNDGARFFSGRLVKDILLADKKPERAHAHIKS